MEIITKIPFRMSRHFKTLLKSYSVDTKSLNHRKGDGGITSTQSGQTLPKNDILFQVIGSTEELLGHIGLACEYALENKHSYTDILKRVQHILIDITTNISNSHLNSNRTQFLSSRHTKELDEWIEEYSEKLAPVDHYIIPGGGKTSASLSIARAVCRRAERLATEPVIDGRIDKEVQIYLNRLGDFLFTISRTASISDKREESIYIPRPDGLEVKKA